MKHNQPVHNVQCEEEGFLLKSELLLDVNQPVSQDTPHPGEQEMKAVARRGAAEVKGASPWCDGGVSQEIGGQGVACLKNRSSG